MPLGMCDKMPHPRISARLLSLTQKCTPNASRQVALMLPTDIVPTNLLIGTLCVWFGEA